MDIGIPGEVVDSINAEVSAGATAHLPPAAAHWQASLPLLDPSAPSFDMQKQLADIIDAFESAQHRLRLLADRVSIQQWSQRPAPDSWSAAECVEHLNLTSRAYLPLLRDAWAEARLLRVTPRVYRHDALGWFMAAMMGPVRHFGKFRVGRVKTTADFAPGAGRDRTEILSDFVRMQGDLIALTRSADGLAIDRVKIVSPFGGKMKYTAYSALVILHRHEHRHLDQAEAAATNGL